MLAEGTMLGKYRILRMLGAGGMADVYEAEDQMLGRRVALKVLPPEFGRDPQAVARFEKEVRAAASLNHAHIVTIFEVDKADNIHFCAMRLLKGGDLRARMDQGLSENQALDIIRQIAEAFVHAHAVGFVHRDVKPENILFDEQGCAILTDFGIAKAMSSQAKMTATGVSIGTPRYISPEQARGLQVDGRSDLYSLGAILYEMLAGKPPYEADDSLAIIFQHVTEPIPRLAEPFARFQPLIDSLMAKEPAQRPESAAALIKLLDALPRKASRRVAAAPSAAAAASAKAPVEAQTPVVTAEREHAERLAREERRQRDAAAERHPVKAAEPGPAAADVPAPATRAAASEPAPPEPAAPQASAAAKPAAPTPPRRRPVVETTRESGPGTPSSRFPLLAGAAAVVVTVVLLAWWLASPSGKPAPAVAAAAPTRPAATARPASTVAPEPTAEPQAVAAVSIEAASDAVVEDATPEPSATAAPTPDAAKQRQAEAARRKAAEERRRRREAERSSREQASLATPAPLLSPEKQMARERAQCKRHVSALFPGFTFTYADIVKYPGSTRRADGLIVTPALATDYGTPQQYLINANGCIVGTAN